MLLLHDPLQIDRLVARPCRLRDRAGAHLWAPTLDHLLAAGRSPDAGRLVATRAQALVSPARRQALAHDWEHLVEVAGRTPQRSVRRVPLCRDRIAAAEPAITDMLVALVAPGPVPARGVAMARLLLGDGAGPLYNRRCPVDVVAAVGDVTAHLSPAASLLASA
jgi:hypothetical protein